ncbi:MAG: OmpA family protein [Ignavibacteria bacterium]|jgi:chemotaxis protein MotB|nr:OmpA family protein [Ignavibacteria bacterium]MCU7501937.1 OmpA family protein [Ignavibacteria bacterium]MCU7514717.1 OmpA family protein [Ignavibacteria bacterium]
MALDEGQGPIIIQKKKKAHGDHHGGAWKVAYADFVTAMMALFIVLWILGQSEKVKQSVSSYFKDPVGFSSKKGKFILDGKGPSPVNVKLQAEMASKEMEKQRLDQMGQTIVNEMSQSPEFKDLMDQVKIEFIDEGMRIEIMESFDDIFFEIGTSELKPRALSIIKKIGTELKKLPNKIVIEGHTDARPYSGNGVGYTNFELSAERANSARRALTASGVRQEQIDEVRGYADKRLRNKDNPLDVTNRRISIIVKYSGK